MGGPGDVYTHWVSRVACYARANPPTVPQFRRPAHTSRYTHIMSDNVSSGSLPAPSATSGADHLLSRLVGVIFSPQATFARIVAQPRWLGAMALVTVTISLITFAFLS